jgi:hypothetical protein
MTKIILRLLILLLLLFFIIPPIENYTTNNSNYNYITKLPLEKKNNVTDYKKKIKYIDEYIEYYEYNTNSEISLMLDL